jgi:hypothetical protein
MINNVHYEFISRYLAEFSTGEKCNTPIKKPSTRLGFLLFFVFLVRRFCLTLYGREQPADVRLYDIIRNQVNTR